MKIKLKDPQALPNAWKSCGMTMEEWIRYYNEVTKAYVKDQTIDGKLYGMDSLMDIETKEILTSAEAFVMSG